MKDFIQRIIFYLRYEMTHDVEVRIEATCIACVMLAGLGIAGYQLYTLHSAEQESTEQQAALPEEMKQCIEQVRRQPHKAKYPEYEVPQLVLR